MAIKCPSSWTIAPRSSPKIHRSGSSISHAARSRNAPPDTRILLPRKFQQCPAENHRRMIPPLPCCPRLCHRVHRPLSRTHQPGGQPKTDQFRPRRIKTADQRQHAEHPQYCQNLNADHMRHSVSFRSRRTVHNSVGHFITPYILQRFPAGNVSFPSNPSFST